jgi:hypothetical protein
VVTEGRVPYDSLAERGLSLIDLASQARLRLGPWPVAANGRCGVARKLWAMAHAAREVQGMAEGPGAGGMGPALPVNRRRRWPRP